MMPITVGVHETIIMLHAMEAEQQLHLVAQQQAAAACTV
jgi:hypothetical protein